MQAARRVRGLSRNKVPYRSFCPVEGQQSERWLAGHLAIEFDEAPSRGIFGDQRIWDRIYKEPCALFRRHEAGMSGKVGLTNTRRLSSRTITVSRKTLPKTRHRATPSCALTIPRGRRGWRACCLPIPVVAKGA